MKQFLLTVSVLVLSQVWLGHAGTPAELKQVGDGIAKAAMAQDMAVDFKSSPAEGIGPAKGVMRRDPSDIIKVGNLYYVWYTRSVARVPHGYNATDVPSFVCLAAPENGTFRFSQSGNVEAP